MKYFLDFDRTIFNTPAFKKSLARRQAFLLRLGLLRVTQEEMRSFLYPDVPGFLETHDCTIVTYGVRAFITAKVTSAVGNLPVRDIVYTSRKKGRTIRRLAAAMEGPFTFVDDAHFQCASVQAKCADVDVFEIRRDDRAGDGRWPVIRSLDELPKSA